jgi:hypothetical protein
MSRIWITTGLIFSSSVATAHLGHAAGEDFGFAHYLLDPAHVALTVTVVALWMTVRWFSRRSRAENHGVQ